MQLKPWIIPMLYCFGISSGYVPMIYRLADAAEIESETISKKPSGLSEYKEKLIQIEDSIQLTKKKMAKTETSKYLPDLYYMLAELMLDRGNYLYAIKKEINKGVPDEQIDFTAEKRAKLEGIDAFKQLADRYPTHKSIAKVYFVIAQELKNIAEIDQALQYYKKVAEQFSKSEYTPKSVMEIGNIFYEKKDFEFALQHFQKASLSAKGLDSLHIANKMASCLAFKGEWRKSFEQYIWVLRSPLKNEKDLVEAKEEALLQSVWPLLEFEEKEYPQLKKPQELVAFYQANSFDQISYKKVLERLAKRLEFKKRENHAAAIHLEIFRLSRDSKNKKESFEFYFNINRADSAVQFPLWIPRQLMETLVSGSRFINNEDNIKERLRFEEAFRHILTSQHKNVIQMKRANDYIEVIKNYNYYLILFDRQLLKNVSAARPKGGASESVGDKYLAMLKNKAELEFLAEQYLDAAADYLQVSKLQIEQGTPNFKEFLISSMDAALKAMGLKQKEEDLFLKIRAREFYRQAANLFKKKFPGDSKLVEIEFNIAKTIYDDQRLVEASEKLVQFVRQFPRAEQVSSAVILAMDCYYLQDKMDKVGQVGKTLLSISGLPEGVKAQIQSSLQQAQLKKVKSLAGDFSSSDYAAEFMAFAKQNRNSSMGEQALFEAFISLKSASDEKALSVGEEYMASYSQQARAKEVLLQMSQLSLVLLDFKRAAKYMAVYGQKYSTDPNAKELLTQSAGLLARIGDSKESFLIYQVLGQPELGLENLSQWGNWEELEKLSRSVGGLLGSFYLGLSQWRLGQKSEALNTMNQVFSGLANSEEEKELWSRAGVILSENMAENFNQQTRVSSMTMPELQNLLEQFQNMGAVNQKIIASGAGLWRLAALAIDTQNNKRFADFLSQLNPPGEVSRDQFKKIVAPQIAQYLETAKQSAATCLQVGEENEIPSGYISLCRQNIKWSEQSEAFQLRRSRLGSSFGNAQLRNQIKANPRSAELIKKYSIARIEVRDEATALVLLTRAQDLEPQSSEIDALKALAWLRLGAFQNAMGSVKNSESKDLSDPLALEIHKHLLKKFGYFKKLNQVSARTSNKKSPYIHLIPR